MFAILQYLFIINLINNFLNHLLCLILNAYQNTSYFKLFINYSNDSNTLFYDLMILTIL